VAGVGDYVLRIITRDGKTFNYRVTAADGRTVKVNLGKGCARATSRSSS
jgi:hypothetical protein